MITAILSLHQSIYFLLNEIFLSCVLNLFLVIQVLLNTKISRIKRFAAKLIINDIFVKKNYIFSIKIIIFFSIISVILYADLLYNLILADFYYSFCVELCNKQIRITPFIILTKFTIAILTFFLLLILLIYINKQKNVNYNGHIFLIFCVIGLLTIVHSNDFISLYLSLELTGISIYCILGNQINSKQMSEASLKYFILSAFSTGLFLFGTSVIYCFCGTINFTNLHHYLNELSFNTITYYLILMGLIFIYCSFLLKLGIAPFHLWVMDVYAGSEYIIILFVTTIPKFAYIFILHYFTQFIFYQYSMVINLLLISVGILSICIGIFGAFYQTNIKQLIAFSAINNMGFILLNLLVLSSFSLVYIYIFLYIYVILMFTLIISIINLYNYHSNKPIIFLKQLLNLLHYKPAISLILGINIISLAGLPPFYGFYMKFFILQNIFEVSYFIAIVLLILNFIGSLYYLRLVKIMFFETNFHYNFVQYFKNIKFLSSYILIIGVFINLFGLIILNDCIIFLDTL